MRKFDMETANSSSLLALAVSLCTAFIASVWYRSQRNRLTAGRLQRIREALAKHLEAEMQRTTHLQQSEQGSLKLLEKCLASTVEEYLMGAYVIISLNSPYRRTASMTTTEYRTGSIEQAASLIQEAESRKQNVHSTTLSSPASSIMIAHPILDTDGTVHGTISFQREWLLEQEDMVVLDLIDLHCTEALRRCYEAQVERIMKDCCKLLAPKGGLDTTEDTTVAVLKRTANTIRSHLYADSVRVFLWNSKQCHVTALEDVNKAVKTFSNPSGLVAQCISDHVVVNIADTSCADNFCKEYDQPEGCHAQSILCVPFGSNGEPSAAGAIQVINKRDKRKNGKLKEFNSEDVRLVSRICDMLDTALSAAATQLEAARLKEKYKLLVKVVRTISANSLTDPGRAVNDILVNTKGLLHTQSLSLFHVNKAGDALLCLDGDHFERGYTIPIGEGLGGTVLLTGEPLVTRVGSAEDVTIVPIKSKDGKMLGAIEAITTRRDESASIVADLLSLSQQEMLRMDVLADVAEEFSVLLERNSAIARTHWFSKIATASKRRRSFKIDYSKMKSDSTAAHAEQRRKSPLIKQDIVQSARALQEFKSWNCAPWQYSDEAQNLLVRHAFEEFGLIEEFSISRDILSNYIAELLSKYNPSVFYHNRNHAFATLQCCYQILSVTQSAQILKPLEILGLLIAAIGHDVAHPGFTNAFLIEVKHQLVLLYGAQSVLESHHTYITCSLLKQEKLNFVKHLDSCQLRELNQTIIRAILSTDMAGHFDKIKDLRKKRMEVNKNMLYRTEVVPDKDRLAGVLTNEYIVDTIIHCCDLSGQVYPRDIAQEWSNAIVKEFSRQAEHELNENISISQYMHNLDTEYNQNKLQMEFIDAIIQPYWDEIIFFFPELISCYSNLADNREFYRSEMERLSETTEQKTNSETQHSNPASSKQLKQQTVDTLDDIVDEYVVESKED